MKERVIVLFGPTASGKTAAALRLAGELGGEVINADSRQIYAQMPIVTACPSAEEYGRVPHHLFEFLDPAERYSAGAWAAAAKDKIAEVLARGRVPVVVGGTGFYIRALVEGVSEVPALPPEVEREFDGFAAQELHRMLGHVDPVLAARLNPTDMQRIVRGLAVQRHTGKPLSVWQEGPKVPAPYDFVKLALSPEREVLHERIARRWELMREAGVVDEVRALKDAGYSRELPGLTGLAVAELYDYIDGHLSWEEATAQAVAGTRQYAKRQVTWLRNSYGAVREFASADEVQAEL